VTPRTFVGSAQDVVWTDDAPYLTCERRWDVIGHGRGYVMGLVEVPIMFDLSHVRRERGQLYGQIRVLSDLDGTASLSRRDRRTLHDQSDGSVEAEGVCEPTC
jgi:hypothetical protein